MDAKTAPARERRRPPRPEALLAVLYRLEDGPHIELTIARWLEDADLFAANITRDPTGAMAINLTATEGTKIRATGQHRAVLTIGPSGCHALNTRSGDSLLLYQQQGNRRSAQALVTLLSASASFTPRGG
ncbi:MAG: hypothetical protein AAFU77_08945 [Myxococcota bacterium]